MKIYFLTLRNFPIDLPCSIPCWKKNYKFVFFQTNSDVKIHMANKTKIIFKFSIERSMSVCCKVSDP